MIKFLADENIPSGVTKFLRDRGFDVKEVAGAKNAGASDDAVMVLARKEQRVLLTFDKHFANTLSIHPTAIRGSSEFAFPRPSLMTSFGRWIS